jgi:hypothetical protein
MSFILNDASRAGFDAVAAKKVLMRLASQFLPFPSTGGTASWM